MTGQATIGAAWRRASQRIDRLDARLLLEHVCGIRHADLIAHPECELTPAQIDRLDALLARRAAGEPLAYLLQSAFFYGLEFVVSPDVLIPREDTGALVDQALEKARGLDRPAIVDLGTGAGIVAIVLAKRCPNAEITAVDVSPAALAVARTNAERHGTCVRFLAGDWYAPLGDVRFDLIVSNPPYVVAGDPHLAQNGLPFEPQTALTDGVVGGDGLACIRYIVNGAAAHLQRGGWLLMEHGYDQAVKVRDLLGAAGFCDVASWHDGAGIERVTGGRLP